MKKDGYEEDITKEEQTMAREYLCDFSTPNNQLHKSFICLIMRSRANLCIIPIQDYLGLGKEGRMNKPSTVGTNWKWRITLEQLSEEVKEEIYEITKRYGRI